MRYEFHSNALEEYQAAATYYASCQDHLGLRFVESVESAIKQIVAAPTQWHLLEDDLRQHLVPVFPYAIIYTIELEYVLIIAVMHCHRKPGYWRHRV